MTAYHTHLDSLRELQVKLSMTNLRVLLVQLEELAFLEEQHCVEVVLLDLPKLLLKRTHLIPSFPRDIACSRVVVRMIRSILVLVHDFLRSDKAETRFVLLLPLSGFFSSTFSSSQEGVGVASTASSL